MDQDLNIVVDNGEYKISKTKINGLLIFERKLFSDERGYYQEFARTPAIEEILGRPISIKQWALSYSLPGVLRGIHAEPQDKIVTPMTGKLFVAICDLREDSETFGQYQSFNFDLTDPYTPKKSIVISNGLGNSFMTLGNSPVEYFYAVSEVYKGSEGKRSILWNDQDLKINWPEDPKIISEADKNNPTLRELFPEKFK
ncbi:MAG: dTDP-4-dehydrorhamnose 3,5-epimerase family protein [Actinobacteria bacterium]|nr:dTDP-4-dehydrorhamnose 3,5-epimerase family protein [Actinomycetota bacterium]